MGDIDLDQYLPEFDDSLPKSRNPTRRKKITQQSNCMWLDKDIHYCVKERNENKTKYRELRKETGLALSTIWTKVKSLNNGGEMRPKQGPKFKVPLTDEKEMVTFLTECSKQGDPCTEGNVSQDICHFLKCYGYENTFKKKKPGRGYFRRFRAYYPQAVIVSVDEKRAAVMQMTPFLDWAFNRDRYMIEAHDSFCTSANAIVLLEAVELNSPNCDISFKLLGAYTAAGQIIKMIAIHGGEVLDYIQDAYMDKIRFVTSDDGDVSFDAVGMAVQEVYRFMRDEQVPKPIMLYMPADVYSHYGYAAWRFVSGLEMKAYRVPTNIFKDALDENLTLQDKLQTALNVEVTKKFLNKKKALTIETFMHSLSIIVKRGMTRALKIPFNKLQLLTLEPPKPDTEYSYIPYIDVDNMNHDETEAREGDVQVYDQIMQHDVYRQMGRPLEPTAADHDPTDGVHQVQENGSTHEDDGMQQRQEDGNSTGNDANTEDVSHPPEEPNDATHDIGVFIENELANPETLDNFYTSGNSILDEFEDPADFPSDVD